MAYHAHRTNSFFNRRFWVVIICVIIIAVIGGVGAVRHWYSNNLAPVSSATQTQYFTVDQGMGLPQIAKGLQDQKLIRSSRAFVTYARSNEYQDKLQAGTYELSPSMSVEQIVQKLAKGEVAKNLLTILPGKRLDQIEATLQKSGYNQAQIGVAFRPSNYTGHPALTSLPPGASLEGYLYPDSFQKEITTAPEVIIKKSLDEMQQHLTPDILNGFAAQGLNIYQGNIFLQPKQENLSDGGHVRRRVGFLKYD